MPIIANNGTLTIELARLSYDFDRNRLVAVWRLTVAGVKTPSEVTTEMPVQELLADLPTECAALYQWVAARAVAAGDIPAGEFQ